MPADSPSHYCAASGWPIPRAHRAGARGACRSSAHRSMTRRPRARRAGALRGHRVTWGRQRVALERGRQAHPAAPRLGRAKRAPHDARHGTTSHSGALAPAAAARRRSGRQTTAPPTAQAPGQPRRSTIEEQRCPPTRRRTPANLPDRTFPRAPVDARKLSWP